MSRRVSVRLALVSVVALGLVAGARWQRADMIHIAGGRTRIGADDGEPTERPMFFADVAPFWLDAHPVTVAEFRGFVAATAYRTQAETFGSANVFQVSRGTWQVVEGASWDHPTGPAEPASPDDHPVTQVSWNDAVAYCRWAGKRLPSEVEWEHAARNGQNGGPRYAWGNELVVDGHYMANTWQGEFPHHNTVADQFLSTAPVGSFAKTASGLTDMGGNVWQWCDDWFRPYAERDRPFTPTPESAKVLRGGSFLCDPKFCHGFRVSARGHSTPESGLAHVGFRCARDIP